MLTTYSFETGIFIKQKEGNFNGTKNALVNLLVFQWSRWLTKRSWHVAIPSELQDERTNQTFAQTLRAPQATKLNVHKAEFLKKQTDEIIHRRKMSPRKRVHIIIVTTRIEFRFMKWSYSNCM